MGRQARGPDPSLGGSLFDIFRYLGTGTQLGQQNLQGLQDLQGAGYQADIENTKKYGPELQRLRQQQMEADPLIKRLRGVAIGGLQGLQNGQMPADIERSITNRVRQGQLARGIEDSPFSVGSG